MTKACSARTAGSATLTMQLYPAGGRGRVPAPPPQNPSLRPRNVCWHDCQPFDWEPCMIPEFFDKAREVHYGRGCFCSWDCAKAYCLSKGCRGGTVTAIALLANKVRRVPAGTRHGMATALLLRNLPARERLCMFGGDLTSLQYRAGSTRVDGTIIGGVASDQLPPRQRLPSFMENKGVVLVPCVAVDGEPRCSAARQGATIEATGAPRQTHRQRLPGEDSIRQRLQQRRPPGSRAQVTLDSSMGIVGGADVASGGRRAPALMTGQLISRLPMRERVAAFCGTGTERCGIERLQNGSTPPRSQPSLVAAAAAAAAAALSPCCPSLPSPPERLPADISNAPSVSAWCAAEDLADADVHAPDAAPHFHRECVQMLDSNAAPAADMAWRTEAGLIWDYRGVYARTSPYFLAMVRHGVEEPLSSLASPPPCSRDPCLVVPSNKMEYIRDPKMLRMLRAYCHTGAVLYGKREGAMALLRRYLMCDAYGLHRAAAVVSSALMARLEPSSALAVFDAISGTTMEGSELAAGVAAYIRSRAVDVLCRGSCTKLSDRCVCLLAGELAGDDVNGSEADLMDALYGMCLRRCKQDRESAAQLFFRRWDDGDAGAERGGEEASRPEKRRRTLSLSGPASGPVLDPASGSASEALGVCGGVSLWDCVRPSGLSAQSVVAFRATHPGALPDTFLMDLVQSALGGGQREAGPQAGSQAGPQAGPQAAPRTRLLVTAFPRHVPSPPRRGESFAWPVPAEPGSGPSYYVAIPYRKGDSVRSPPLWCGGRALLQLEVVFGAVHVSATALSSPGMAGVSHALTAQLEAANFRHDRWRRQMLRARTEGDPECESEGTAPRLLSAATLCEAGYLFDPARHPQEAAQETPVSDPHLLLRLSICD
ncbi:hypothetical protein JKP88DRAFT_273031 [Tribonema minus]|uniref:Uncharacterized protein n=1 Tax=Tribonema minus TaxID=303371 RepID=A0A835YX70_9STRA|nr:hypothetical protein JKP88DRAFT_273031 [Tribonema minus]